MIWMIFWIFFSTFPCGSSFSEALQKEKYEHNRMLAEKRDEHLMKEKALYEDLHLLQSQRAKLLKQHDPHNNKIVKENEKLQVSIAIGLIDLNVGTCTSMNPKLSSCVLS